MELVPIDVRPGCTGSGRGASASKERPLEQAQVPTWDLLEGDTLYLANAWRVAAPAVVDFPATAKHGSATSGPVGATSSGTKTHGQSRLTPHMSRPSSADLLRLLNAFAGLCRTPLVQDETKPPSKKSSQAARRARLFDPRIRRLYLRHPETGPDELRALPTGTGRGATWTLGPRPLEEAVDPWGESARRAVRNRSHAFSPRRDRKRDTSGPARSR